MKTGPESDPIVAVVLRIVGTLINGHTDVIKVTSSGAEHRTSQIRLSSFEDVSKIEEAIQDARQFGVRGVIVDLAEVAWINSIGLGRLIAIARDVERCGGEMVLAGSPRMRPCFPGDRTVGGLFRIFDNTARAVDYMASRGAGDAT